MADNDTAEVLKIDTEVNEAIPRITRRREFTHRAFIIGVCRDCGHCAMPGEFRCFACDQ